MTCETGDVLDLLPGYAEQLPQMATSLTAAIATATAELQARLASLYAPSVDAPIFTVIISYLAVSNLLASVMSSNNENGETRLSAYYSQKAEALIKGLLDGSLIALDDNGKPVPTNESTSYLTSAGLGLAVYTDPETAQ